GPSVMSNCSAPLTRIQDVADPLALDPAAHLTRQEVDELLDRALGMLPAPIRQAVAMCYLYQVPQREVALQLGLKIGALEERLRRARHQLRQILNGQLRPAAKAPDVPLDADVLWSWRETREWCHGCGRHRLRGTLEPAPNQRRMLRLRCPACAQQHGLDSLSSKGIVPLDDLRTFRPAIKRTTSGLATTGLRALRMQTCLLCGGPAQVHITPPSEGQGIPDIRKFWLQTQCHACGLAAFTANLLVRTQPEVQAFMARHPRWITAPDQVVEYAGQPAICFQFRDVTSQARVTVLAEQQAMRILATRAV